MLNLDMNRYPDLEVLEVRVRPDPPGTSISGALRSAIHMSLSFNLPVTMIVANKHYRIDADLIVNRILDNGF